MDFSFEDSGTKSSSFPSSVRGREKLKISSRSEGLSSISWVMSSTMQSVSADGLLGGGGGVLLTWVTLEDSSCGVCGEAELSIF